MIVQSESAKKAILAALADEEVMGILDSVMYHSKSVKGIMSENDTSYTTAYRKIKWLLNEGLVIIDKIAARRKKIWFISQCTQIYWC